MMLMDEKFTAKGQLAKQTKLLKLDDVGVYADQINKVLLKTKDNWLNQKHNLYQKKIEHHRIIQATNKQQKDEEKYE